MIKIKQKAALNFEKFLSFSILLKYLNSEEKVYCHLLPFLSHFQEPLARRKYEKPARPLAIFAVEKSNLFSSLSHFHFIHVCNTFLSFSRFFTTRSRHARYANTRARFTSLFRCSLLSLSLSFTRGCFISSFSHLSR